MGASQRLRHRFHRICQNPDCHPQLKKQQVRSVQEGMDNELRPNTAAESSDNERLHLALGAASAASEF